MKLGILTLVIIGIIGSIIPFIDSIAVIQVFFLLIPYLVYFGITLLAFVITLVKRNENRRHALFFLLTLPTFILAQILSIVLVDNVQKLRANQAIDKIEKLKQQHGKYPDDFELSLGIKYFEQKNGEEFKMEYNIGFLISEVYRSETNNWSKRGWND